MTQQPTAAQLTDAVRQSIAIVGSIMILVAGASFYVGAIIGYVLGSNR